MPRWWALLALLVTGLATSPHAATADDEPLYQRDFAKATAGDALPDDFIVLGGEFTLAPHEGRVRLQVAPVELDDFGVLFGPTTRAAVEVEASIRGESQGRRQPRFGVGLGGAGGWRLLVTPVRRELQLWLDQEQVASAPLAWVSGTWLRVRLRVTPGPDGGWRLQGMAWPADAAAPAQWQLTHDSKEAPPEGKAAIYASPYSGRPIQFGDLILRQPRTAAVPPVPAP